MSKLAQWMEITASVGVIVGIIFLIIEISQNTVATENDAIFALQNIYAEQVLVAVENEEIFQVMRKIYSDEELTSEEAFRASIYFSSTMALFEYAHMQSETGLISESLMSSYEDDILLFTHNTEFSKYFWKNHQGLLTESFREYVDSLKAKQPKNP